MLSAGESANKVYHRWVGNMAVVSDKRRGHRENPAAGGAARAVEGRGIEGDVVPY